MRESGVRGVREAWSEACEGERLEGCGWGERELVWRGENVWDTALLHDAMTLSLKLYSISCGDTGRTCSAMDAPVCRTIPPRTCGSFPMAAT